MAGRRNSTQLAGKGAARRNKYDPDDLTDGQKLARQITEDPVYFNALKKRATEGRLPAQLEVTLWQVAYPTPKRVEHTGADGERLMPNVLPVFDIGKLQPENRKALKDMIYAGIGNADAPALPPPPPAAQDAEFHEVPAPQEAPAKPDLDNFTFAPEGETGDYA